MRFVLHHIPKTGGHSIVQSFRAIFGPDAVSIDKGDTPLVTTHGPSWVPFEQYPDRLHITILRDPEERIRSYIRYMRIVLSDTNGVDVGQLARNLPPSKFLRFENADIRRYTHDRHVRQLGGFDYDDSEVVMPRLLERALESLSRMVWVGYTGTLTDDLDALFGKLNPRLPPQNTSPNPAIGPIEGLDALTSWDNRLLRAWEARQ